MIEGNAPGGQRKSLFNKRNPFHSRMLGLKRTPSQHADDSPIAGKGTGGVEEIHEIPTSPTCVAQQLTTVPTTIRIPTSMPAKAQEIDVGTAPAEKVVRKAEDDAAVLQAEADAISLVADVLASAEAEEASAVGRAIVEAAVEKAMREAEEWEMACNDAARDFTDRVIALAVADINAEVKPAVPARQTSDSIAAVALKLAPKWRQSYTGLWGKLRAFGPDLSSILRDAEFERETAEQNPFRWE